MERTLGRGMKRLPFRRGSKPHTRAPSLPMSQHPCSAMLLRVLVLTVRVGGGMVCWDEEYPYHFVRWMKRDFACSLRSFVGLASTPWCCCCTRGVGGCG